MVGREWAGGVNCRTRLKLHRGRETGFTTLVHKRRLSVIICMVGQSKACCMIDGEAKGSFFPCLEREWKQKLGEKKGSTRTA